MDLLIAFKIKLLFFPPLFNLIGGFESIKLYGPAKGLALCLKRILKCHPIKLLGGGNGFDPVPNIKRGKK